MSLHHPHQLQHWLDRSHISSPYCTPYTFKAHHLTTNMNRSSSANPARVKRLIKVYQQRPTAELQEACSWHNTQPKQLLTLPSNASFSALYLVVASRHLGHMFLDSPHHRHHHQIAPSDMIILSLTSSRQMVHPLLLAKHPAEPLPHQQLNQPPLLLHYNERLLHCPLCQHHCHRHRCCRRH